MNQLSNYGLYSYTYVYTYLYSKSIYITKNNIINFSDGQARTKWKAAVWHPTVATQLCLASEDDLNPVVQLWDLRSYN